MYKRRVRGQLTPRALRSITRSAEAAERMSTPELAKVRARAAAYLKTGTRQPSEKYIDGLADQVQRYARGGSVTSAMLSVFGALGKAVEFVLGGLKRPGVTPQSVRDAIELLEQTAPEALAVTHYPADPSAPSAPPRQPRPMLPSGKRLPDEPPPLPKGRRLPAEKPLPRGRRLPPEPPKAVEQEQLPQGRFPHGLGIAMQPVSNSTNVHSYGYDPVTRTLRVCYLAAAINASAVSGREPLKGKFKHPRGTLGRTVTQHRYGAGPMYDYFNVPPLVFQRFESAGSKGKAVWDLLRIRGTIEGHQYQYALTAAGRHDLLDLNTGTVKGKVTYVPRRAVRGGFQQRTSLQGAQGDRSFKSLLPTRMQPSRVGPRQPGEPNDGSQGLF